MKENKIICLLGQTSSGKTTLEQKVLRILHKKGYDIIPLTSATTRPMRDYEKQFDPYYFVSDTEFNELVQQGKMAEYSSYKVANGETWYYGTPSGLVDLEKHTYLKVANPQGYRQFINHYGKENVIGIYLYCGEKERLLRSLVREENPNCEEICRRFLSDKASFDGIESEVIASVFNQDNIDVSAEVVVNWILKFTGEKNSNETEDNY